MAAGLPGRVNCSSHVQSEFLPGSPIPCMYLKPPGQATLHYNLFVFLFFSPTGLVALWVGTVPSPVSPQSLAYSQFSPNAC